MAKPVPRKCIDADKFKESEIGDNNFQYRYFTIPVEQIPYYDPTKIQVLHHGIGSVGGGLGLFWYCPYGYDPDDKDCEISMASRQISENADATTVDKITEGESLQILANDGGCAKWIKIKEQEIIYGLELKENKLAWKKKKVFIIGHTEDETDGEIDTTDCAPEQ